MYHLLKYLKLSKEDKKYYNYLKSNADQVKSMGIEGEDYTVAIFGLAYEYFVLGFKNKALNLIQEEIKESTFPGLYQVMKSDENICMVSFVVLAQMKISKRFNNNYFFEILLGEIEREQLPFASDPKYSKVPYIVSSYRYFYDSIILKI